MPSRTFFPFNIFFFTPEYGFLTGRKTIATKGDNFKVNCRNRRWQFHLAKPAGNHYMWATKMAGSKNPKPLDILHKVVLGVRYVLSEYIAYEEESHEKIKPAPPDRRGCRDSDRRRFFSFAVF
jgi:hypothetical protein